MDKNTLERSREKSIWVNLATLSVMDTNLNYQENRWVLTTMSGNISINWRNSWSLSTMSGNIHASENADSWKISTMSWNIDIKWVNQGRLDTMSWGISVGENIWIITSKSGEVYIRKNQIRASVSWIFTSQANGNAIVSGSWNVVIGSMNSWNVVINNGQVTINGQKQTPNSTVEWFMQVDGIRINKAGKVVAWNLNGSPLKIEWDSVMLDYKWQRFTFDTKNWNLIVKAQ